MTPQERTQLQQLTQTVNDLKAFIERYFNFDGTLKAPAIVVQTQDTNTTPSGSIRVETNLGPKNILIV